MILCFLPDLGENMQQGKRAKYHDMIKYKGWGENVSKTSTNVTQMSGNAEKTSIHEALTCFMLNILKKLRTKACHG